MKNWLMFVLLSVTTTISLTANSKEKITNRSYVPIVFDGAATKLPSKYSANNPTGFFKLFASRAEVPAVFGTSIYAPLNIVPKKREFETTAEFEARKGSAETRLLPLRMDKSYAFVLPIEITYDADQQTYRLKGGLVCLKADRSRKWITCNLGNLYRHDSDYVGSNAYGASRTVRKIKIERMGLAVLPEHLFVDQFLTKEIDASGYKSSVYSDFVYNLPMHINKARAYQGKAISVVVVGRILAPKIIEGKWYYSTPTIDDLVDMDNREWDIPFSPESIVIYVHQTGEILKKIDFDPLGPGGFVADGKIPDNGEPDANATQGWSCKIGFTQINHRCEKQSGQF